jgi:hypothetical protein
MRNLAMIGLSVALLGILTANTQAETFVQAWEQLFGLGGSGVAATAIAVATNGNVFVTGSYATIAYSSAGEPLWTNRYDSSGFGFTATAAALAVDGSDNFFVTGYAPHGGSPYPYEDYVTVACSSAGVPLWTNRYNGPSDRDDVPSALAVDKNGNVFVTGYSFSTNSGADYVTIAYSSAGAQLWTNRYNWRDNNNDYATAIAVDSSNRVYVTGYSYGNASFRDYSTIAYSNTGVPLWTNRYNGPANDDDYARAIAVDGSNNVYVTGNSYGGSVYYHGSGYDYATVAYSSAGLPLWTRRYNGPANSEDYAVGIAVHRSGNVYVTGNSWGSISSGYDDYATVAYSSAGVPLWTQRYDGPAGGQDLGRAVAVAPNGNVYVTGLSAESNKNDYATIAYSGAGVPLWTNRYIGPSNTSDYATAIAVDVSGNVYVTGGSDDGSSIRYATIKYSSLQPIPLKSQWANNQLVLSWASTAFSLQRATAVTGVFTNLIGATSPYTNPVTGPQQYFRLISN